MQEQLKDEINNLNDTLSAKDKIINKLQTEKEKIQSELQKFKNFWHKVMKHFQNKIGFDKDKQYKYVADDLHKADIFTNDEFEIATNPARKVKPPKEDKNNEQIKKKNDMNLK